MPATKRHLEQLLEQIRTAELELHRAVVAAQRAEQPRVMRNLACALSDMQLAKDETNDVLKQGSGALGR